MHLETAAAWAFMGTMWFANVMLALGLLVAPRRVVAFLIRRPTKIEDWLRAVGVLVLLNTVFAVLASLMAGMYHRGLMELTPMPP